MKLKGILNFSIFLFVLFSNNNAFAIPENKDISRDDLIKIEKYINHIKTLNYISRKGPNPQQLLNDFINNWKEKEFTEFSFRERGSFQLDLQKIIPFKWKSFGDMADKNHLPTFEDQLTNEELRKLDGLLSDLEKKWSKDYREFKSISILTDEEMIVRWNDDIENMKK